MSSIKGNLKEITWVTTWQFKCLNRECPICRSSIEMNIETGISIGCCGHGFHTECLGNWFNQLNCHNLSTKCPVCNKPWSEK